MTYAALSDDALDKEKRRLSQKATDLARDLNAVNRQLDAIKREEHNRFCDRVKHLTK